jgi:hypothetical protein
MKIAGVREALHTQPFQPFVIRLADGRRPSGLRCRWPGRVSAITEKGSWSIVEPLLIVSLD